MVEQISVTQLSQLLAASPAEALIHLVDVREPHEYEQAHVAQAVLVPMGSVPDRLAEFTGSPDPIYVICEAGMRSQQVAEFLEQHGVNAVNVAGGTGQWRAAGYPLSTGMPQP